ncbi:hypothetical protein CGLO_12608 [Colletotrichum gloeosporioides Cg-14]|uniref:Uncharacterized protein n=1 Tax=Colletotrichum gloeosporioides (strain Cg-14) TaxID=1237896 RepID=T0JY69_COLGC|nr:hypothetical protein CGLO_12608 [Colletotrichum gloeosporioides Cg-14]
MAYLLTLSGDLVFSK